MQPIARFTFLALASVFLVSPASAEENVRLSRLAKLRKEAIIAADRQTATRAYTELFDYVNDEELAELKSDPNIGIALNACYRA